VTSCGVSFYQEEAIAKGRGRQIAPKEWKNVLEIETRGKETAHRELNRKFGNREDLVTSAN